MGLFDKIKGLFYDTEDVEDEKVEDNPKPKKQEEIIIKSGNVALKEKEENSIKENINNNIESIDETLSERDLVTSNQNFKFPIIFEDKDIAQIEKEDHFKKQEEKVREEHTKKYQKPILDRKVIDEVVKKPKKFQPTPIISPIYGILDKNYEKPKETESNNTYKKNKELELNFDTVRQKAYGTLSDDLEKELSKSEEKIDEIENKIDNILEENNLLSDLQDDDTNKYSDDNLYNYEDFGVEYKIGDSNIKNDTKDNTNKKDKEVELTEDLFNLIDSMYDKERGR